MVRLKIGSNDLFYHKLQGENVRSTYTVFTLCVFKYIQPYKNMNIVMCLILTTTLRNSLKYDKFLFFDNNLICFATKISSMPNISNLIYIYIYLIYYIISLSVCKKRVLQKPCQCIQYSLYMYIDFIGKKKCFNVICMYKTTYQTNSTATDNLSIALSFYQSSLSLSLSSPLSLSLSYKTSTF